MTNLVYMIALSAELDDTTIRLFETSEAFRDAMKGKIVDYGEWFSNHMRPASDFISIDGNPLLFLELEAAIPPMEGISTLLNTMSKERRHEILVEAFNNLPSKFNEYLEEHSKIDYNLSPEYEDLWDKYEVVSLDTDVSKIPFVFDDEGNVLKATYVSEPNKVLMVMMDEHNETHELGSFNLFLTSPQMINTYGNKIVIADENMDTYAKAVCIPLSVEEFLNSGSKLTADYILEKTTVTGMTGLTKEMITEALNRLPDNFVEFLKTFYKIVNEMRDDSEYNKMWMDYGLIDYDLISDTPEIPHIFNYKGEAY